MQCPTCHTPLTPNTLHGQTIDRCHTCDGLWLDDSELGPIVRQTTPPSVLTAPTSGWGRSEAKTPANAAN